jgi:hypothetical protein
LSTEEQLRKSEIEQPPAMFVVEGDDSAIDWEGDGLKTGQGAAVPLTPARGDFGWELGL